MLVALGDQLVSQQADIIQNAAKRDRVDKPIMGKEDVGPATREAIKQSTGPDFSEALTYTATPWWNATSAMIRSKLLERLQKTGSMGATKNDRAPEPKRAL